MEHSTDRGSTDAAPRARAGRRQRRRGLYGPPPRLTRTSPLTGRLVWHIGDWGRASEHIGARWEDVAGDPRARAARRRRPPGRSGRRRPTLMAEVLGSGLPHADALRAWREDGQLALEPLDFKWSLETASARQVSAKRWRGCWPPSWRRSTRRWPKRARRSAWMPPRRSSAHDGPFRRADASRQSRRAAAPSPSCQRCCCRSSRTRSSSRCQAGPRRGAGALGSRPTSTGCSSIEAIERYYRLGAGVEGALSRLHTVCSKPSRAKSMHPR